MEHRIDETNDLQKRKTLQTQIAMQIIKSHHQEEN